VELLAEETRIIRAGMNDARREPYFEELSMRTPALQTHAEEPRTETKWRPGAAQR